MHLTVAASSYVHRAYTKASRSNTENCRLDPVPMLGKNAWPRPQQLQMHLYFVRPGWCWHQTLYLALAAVVGWSPTADSHEKFERARTGVRWRAEQDYKRFTVVPKPARIWPARVLSKFVSCSLKRSLKKVSVYPEQDPSSPLLVQKTVALTRCPSLGRIRGRGPGNCRCVFTLCGLAGAGTERFPLCLALLRRTRRPLVR